MDDWSFSDHAHASVTRPPACNRPGAVILESARPFMDDGRGPSTAAGPHQTLTPRRAPRPEKDACPRLGRLCGHQDHAGLWRRQPHVGHAIGRVAEAQVDQDHPGPAAHQCPAARTRSASYAPSSSAEARMSTRAGWCPNRLMSDLPGSRANLLRPPGGQQREKQRNRHFPSAPRAVSSPALGGPRPTYGGERPRRGG
jgi:hypothetical protein